MNLPFETLVESLSKETNPLAKTSLTTILLNRPLTAEQFDSLEGILGYPTEWQLVRRYLQFSAQSEKAISWATKLMVSLRLYASGEFRLREDIENMLPTLRQPFVSFYPKLDKLTAILLYKKIAIGDIGRLRQAGININEIGGR